MGSIRGLLLNLVPGLGGGGILPYSDDFTSLNPRWRGTSLAVVDGKMQITPTLGAELVEVGPDTFGGGGTYLFAYGTNALANVSRGGSLKLQVTGDGSDARGMTFKLRLSAGHLTANTTPGQWYRLSVDAEADTDDTVTYLIVDGVGAVTWFTFPVGGEQTFVGQFAPRAADPELYSGGMATGEVIWVDNYSVKPVTFASQFALIQTGSMRVNAKAAVTLPGAEVFAAGGVAVNINDPTTPTSGVIAYTRSGTVSLWKYVNGTPTGLIFETSAAYEAGGVIEIRTPSTNTYQLWYRGTQVGADQIISDAAIVSNTYHGLFTASSGVRFDVFFCSTL